MNLDFSGENKSSLMRKTRRIPKIIKKKKEKNELI